MKITIHAETAKTDGQQVYEGESGAEALEFLNNLEDVTVVQAFMSNNFKGEVRSLSRTGKGDAAKSLVADIESWLGENGVAVGK